MTSFAASRLSRFDHGCLKRGCRDRREHSEALPGVLGIQGEGLFIFRDLGRRDIYFQGFGEKVGF